MAAKRRNSAPETMGFTATLVILSIAAIIVIWPFLSALLWALLAAIVFQPLQNWCLRKTGNKTNLAAALALLIIVLVVVIPLLVIGAIVISQASSIYISMEMEEFDVRGFFVALYDALPLRLREMLSSAGYGDFEQVKMKIINAAKESLGLIASQAFSIGSGALAFVLSLAVGLYVTFFLLRDGKDLGAKFCAALPMEPEVSERLCARSVSIVRATLKGSIVVGMVQGALGIITFWIAGVPSAVLLGVLMSLASFIPAIGTALIWVPVALWLILTGAVWQGFVVVISGALVIGMADNILRPILVGRDTGIPDWVILISTLGGIAAMGLSGIVIGPVLIGLFMAAWSIVLEKREVARV